MIQQAFNLGFKPTAYVYEIDTDNLAADSWMSCEQVAQYVPDAKDNHEYWVTVPLGHIPCKKYIVTDAMIREVNMGHEIGYLAYNASIRQQSNARDNIEKFLSSLQITRKSRNILHKIIKEGNYEISAFVTWYARGELEFLFDKLP